MFHSNQKCCLVSPDETLKKNPEVPAVTRKDIVFPLSST